jgi:hypothetical protein
MGVPCPAGLRVKGAVRGGCGYRDCGQCRDRVRDGVSLSRVRLGTPSKSTESDSESRVTVTVPTVKLAAALAIRTPKDCEEHLTPAEVAVQQIVTDSRLFKLLPVRFHWQVCRGLRLRVTYLRLAGGVICVLASLSLLSLA